MKKRWVTAGSERVHYLKVGEYTVATVDRRDGWWCVHVFGRQTEGSPATLKDVKKVAVREFKRVLTQLCEAEVPL